MITAGELVNDNGISSVALAFFTVLLTSVCTMIVQLYQTKLEVKSSRKSLSSKMDEINIKHEVFDKRLDKFDTALREHLQWHLETGGNKNGDHFRRPDQARPQQPAHPERHEGQHD